MTKNRKHLLNIQDNTNIPQLNFKELAVEVLLNNYTNSDLINIVDSNRQDQIDILLDPTIESDKKVNLIYFGYEDKLLFDQNVRKQFISKLSLENAKKIVHCIYSNQDKQVIDYESDKQYYDFLNLYINNDFNGFLKCFGLDNFQQDFQEEIKIKGIESIKPSYPLYAYQQEIASKINKLINYTDEKRCMIHLPTGAGKTRTAINVVCDFLRKNKSVVVWLTNRNELSVQAANTFKEAWQQLGNRDIKIYSFFGDSYLDSLGSISEGIVIASVTKIHNYISTKPQIFNDFAENSNLIVFDEAHQSTAPTYRETVNFLMKSVKKEKTFLIGLSATPGRKLNTNEVSEADLDLSNFFDKNKITMSTEGYASPITYLTDHQYLAKPTYNLIEYDGSKIVKLNDFFSSKKHTDEVKDALTNNKERNEQILKVIQEEVQQDSSIIVFATNLDHASELQNVLAIDGIKSYKIDSTDSIENRNFRLHQYKSGNIQVLINYDVLTAGFDAPITNVAIIARPTDSLVAYSQMAGRAMRGKRVGGNEYCKIYTVRDDIPEFTNVIKQFEHWDELWKDI